MDDPVAVTLKVVAVGMLRLWETASAGIFRAHGVVGEHEESLAESRPPAISVRNLPSPVSLWLTQDPSRLWQTRRCRLPRRRCGSIPEWRGPSAQPPV